MMKGLVAVIVLIVSHTTIVTCVCLGNKVQSFALKEGEKKGTVWTFSEEVTPEADFDKFKYLLEINETTLRLKKDFILDGDNNTDLCKLAAENIAFKVKCTDDGSTTVVPMEIQFSDDIPPTFDKDQYIVHTNEGQQKGIVLIDLKVGENVTDKDCGGVVYSYNIESPDDSNNFELHYTSFDVKVITSSTLDYDEQREYHLNISVKTKLSDLEDQKTAYTTVLVMVDDLDNRDPFFTNPTYDLTVPEETNLTDQWFVSTPAILAYDGDTGINTSIIYAIHKTPHDLNVQINATDGRIKINSILNRKNTPSYQLNIEAHQSDKTYKSVMAQLTIQVQDVNDHLPQFSNLNDDVTLSENALAGSWVLPLKVTDDDVGENAKNTISLHSDDSSAFELKQPNNDGVTWLVVKNSTSLSGKTTAHIEIRATNTTPLFGDLACDYTKTCVTKVTVTILDVNDHKPQFGQSPYDFKVFQPKLGQSVGNITASDEDKGDNAKVTFSIGSVTPGTQPCKDAFGVDTGSGEITMKKEIQQSGLCLLNVHACDNPSNGDNKLCTVAPIRIELYYINSTYTFDLYENEPNGSLVFKLPMEDLEIDNPHFRIDSKRLVTNDVLDREQTQEYSLHLKRNGTTVSTITVHVKDVNDNAPIPEHDVYNISLTGFEADGDVIATIKATDKDEGQNAQLSYLLINNRYWLAINKTGQVSLTKMPSDIKDRKMFQALVDVQDNGKPPLTSFVKLQISFPASGNETNSTLLILPLTRNEVITNKEEIEKNLSSIIGHNIKIASVRSVGEVEELGSELVLVPQSGDGKNISSSILERLLKEKAREIYNHFKKPDKKVDENDDDDGDSDSSKDDDGVDPLFKTLFIVFICLCVFFLLIIIVIWRYYKSQNVRKGRQLSVMRSLNRDTKIYDDTWKGDSFSLHENGGGSVSRSNGISPLGLEYENPAFTGDDDDNNMYRHTDRDATSESLSNTEHQSQSGKIPDGNDYDNREENSPIENSGENTDNWTFTSRDNVQDSQKTEDASESSPYDNVNMRPFVSTINIERPQDLSETTYTNVTIGDNSDDVDVESHSSNAYAGDNHLDCDSGFPSDKDGQEEEEEDISSEGQNKTGSDINDRLKVLEYESDSRDDATVNNVPDEPEPDYAKKVRFDHFRRQIAGESADEQKESESAGNDYPSNTFYFLEQTVTAL